MKYEYTAAYIPEGTSIVKELNSFGAEGWELVGPPDVTRRDDGNKTVTTAVAWFKRPLSE